MATGALAVGSAVGANIEIIGEDDNGFLCKRPEDWYSKIEWALQNYGSDNFVRILDRARCAIESQYSVQANFDSFVDAVKYLK